ncbi:hypothetical protein CCR97_28790 [Rhodoplanes elegans]|uniref:Uncharacterized protein n=1 Tax=Rhodoplanes elegans TaxID=29408 RepID=A0A327KBH1_9BRAD|nr:hypothetical protein [Rhodoplanes elegans]MBK5962158.1 hypothetical protein [Rhodoplanes elegans]RAI32648.1 hypothetical protein CH338_23840 [Rhodoplanes elegans]
MRVLVAFLVLLGTAPAIAGTDFNAFVADLRRSERIITAALHAGDRGSLKTEQTRLLKLYSKMLDETEQRDDRRASCGLAATSLSNMAIYIDLPPARALVAIEDGEKSYRRHVADCERYIRKAGGSRR